ncbi:MAG: hypothetical protein M1826_002281 [Phylliscum demangeonii]|nr:MAG: hypothetical protein M1826_002281 [Phylliscum demangeonii]
MIVCLPTATHAGTLITNFVGPSLLVEEISDIFTERIAEKHPMGRQTLSCVWILCFAILRTMAEQLDFAFQALDPIESSRPGIPGLKDLPIILKKANRIVQIDRYLSSLEEVVSFFLLVQHQLQEEPPSDGISSQPFRSRYVQDRAQLEACRAQKKILHEQRLCHTFTQQFDMLIQMVISYSTTQITDRLDHGRKIGDRIAQIGLVIAGIAGVVAPLSLLTGFYGMNVQEFNTGSVITLFEFWQVAFPVALLTAVSVVAVAIWMATSRPRPEVCT